MMQNYLKNQNKIQSKKLPFVIQMGVSYLINSYSCYSLEAKYLSASKAAIHPVPAAVIA